jgi:hypothetical protein
MAIHLALACPDFSPARTHADRSLPVMLCINRILTPARREARSPRCDPGRGTAWYLANSIRHVCANVMLLLLQRCSD